MNNIHLSTSLSAIIVIFIIATFYFNNLILISQGAERKTRDEERRAAKRKMTATGRKKLDELYHPVVDRSEFYSMSDTQKPPVLFSPAEDIEKVKKITRFSHPHFIDFFLFNA